MIMTVLSVVSVVVLITTTFTSVVVSKPCDRSSGDGRKFWYWKCTVSLMVVQ
jgi:hypothetical protein